MNERPFATTDFWLSVYLRYKGFTFLGIQPSLFGTRKEFCFTDSDLLRDAKHKYFSECTMVEPRAFCVESQKLKALLYGGQEVSHG